MDKASISSGISPEDSILFESIATRPIGQIYIHRPLEHHMPHRRAPTAGILSHITDNMKYEFGRNHPEQTGEMEPHGFRTSTWSRLVLLPLLLSLLSLLTILTPTHLHYYHYHY